MHTRIKKKKLRSSIVPRVCVVEERKTYSYSMARHVTRMGAAYMCALSSSPTTEHSEDLESVYRKAEGRASRMRCIHHMHIPGTYIVLDERLSDPWYLVSYYNVDRI